MPLRWNGSPGAPRALFRLALVGSFLLASCGGPDVPNDSGTGPTRISTVPANVGPSECNPPSASQTTKLGTVFTAATEGGFDAAALFPGPAAPSASAQLTVWWHVSGDHALNLTLVGEGREIPVTELSPDPTLNWPGTGDQWKSQLTFPQSGCWRIAIQRGLYRHGDVWLQVS
jgi:hypothetical protein